MNQKGFSLILISIIISVLIISAITGVVLHKQGKLDSLFDRVSELLIKPKTIVIGEESNVDEKLEEAELNVEKTEDEFEKEFSEQLLD